MSLVSQGFSRITRSLQDKDKSLRDQARFNMHDGAHVTKPSWLSRWVRKYLFRRASLPSKMRIFIATKHSALTTEVR